MKLRNSDADEYVSTQAVRLELARKARSTNQIESTISRELRSDDQAICVRICVSVKSIQVVVLFCFNSVTVQSMVKLIQVCGD